MANSKIGQAKDKDAQGYAKLRNIISERLYLERRLNDPEDWQRRFGQIGQTERAEELLKHYKARFTEVQGEEKRLRQAIPISSVTRFPSVVSGFSEYQPDLTLQSNLPHVAPGVPEWAEWEPPQSINGVVSYPDDFYAIPYRAPAAGWGNNNGLEWANLRECSFTGYGNPTGQCSDGAEDYEAIGCAFGGYLTSIISTSPNNDNPAPDSMAMILCFRYTFPRMEPEREAVLFWETDMVGSMRAIGISKAGYIELCPVKNDTDSLGEAAFVRMSPNRLDQSVTYPCSFYWHLQGQKVLRPGQIPELMVGLNVTFLCKLVPPSGGGGIGTGTIYGPVEAETYTGPDRQIKTNALWEEAFFCIRHQQPNSPVFPRQFAPGIRFSLIPI